MQLQGCKRQWGGEWSQNTKGRPTSPLSYLQLAPNPLVCLLETRLQEMYPMTSLAFVQLQIFVSFHAGFFCLMSWTSV
jgi:hypothetical protein